MNYILIIVMSSAAFLPSTFTMTPFVNKEDCEVALKEAKKQWVTVNSESECIDVKKAQKVNEAKEQLRKALEDRNK